MGGAAAERQRRKEQKKDGEPAVVAARTRPGPGRRRARQSYSKRREGRQVDLPKGSMGWPGRRLLRSTVVGLWAPWWVRWRREEGEKGRRRGKRGGCAWAWVDGATTERRGVANTALKGVCANTGEPARPAKRALWTVRDLGGNSCAGLVLKNASGNDQRAEASAGNWEQITPCSVEILRRRKRQHEPKGKGERATRPDRAK